MLLNFLSLSVATGISKSSGKSYKMCRASVLFPFRDISTPNYQVNGYGLSAAELAVHDSGFDAINQVLSEKKFPVSLDCETAIDADGKLMITGLATSTQIPSNVIDDKPFFGNKKTG